MKTPICEILRKIALTVAAVVLVCCLAVSFADTAVAEQEVTAVSYNAYEVVLKAQPTNITAQVTRNGVTSSEPIRYTEFSVTESDKMFNSFTARGYIDGWDEEIVQTVIVMPDDVRYMVNFGGNGTKTEYVAPGEGILGLELDHGGDSGVDEPYFQAILRRFPELLNKTSAKQYGQNTDKYGNWGYVGDSYVGTAKITVKEKDLYEKILFPKRGTDDVAMNFALAKGRYDVYIGTYSYWFSRPCDIVINGVTVEENYQLIPSRQVYKTTVDNDSDLLSIVLEGGGLYDESMVSFVCITDADDNVYTQPSAPKAAESMSLSDNKLLVSGLSGGAKLVAYDYNDGTILVEQTIADEQTEAEIEFADWQLVTSLSRIGLVQQNKRYASDVTVVQRTDISDMEVTFDDVYTSQNVVCAVSGKALSGIVKMTVYDGANVIADSAAHAETDYEGRFEIAQNGTYDVVLTSSVGATSTMTIVVDKIDKDLPQLSLSLTLDGAKQSAADKIVLRLNATTLAPTEKLVCADNDGNETLLGTSADALTLDKSGVYTVKLTNVLHKTVATSVLVALEQADIRTVLLSQSKSGRATEIALRSANGYRAAAVTVYAQTEDGTERMIVNGIDGNFSFNVYDKGTYFVQVDCADGTKEVFVLNVASLDGNATSSFSAVDIVGIALLALSVAFAAFVVVLAVKKYRKR